MESGHLARALLLHRALCTRVCRARKAGVGQTWHAETWRRGGAGINSEGGKARNNRRKGLILPVFAFSLFISRKCTLAPLPAAQALKLLSRDTNYTNCHQFPERNPWEFVKSVSPAQALKGLISSSSLSASAAFTSLSTINPPPSAVLLRRTGQPSTALAVCFLSPLFYARPPAGTSRETAADDCVHAAARVRSAHAHALLVRRPPNPPALSQA